jgi:hypothetical protein
MARALRVPSRGATGAVSVISASASPFAAITANVGQLGAVIAQNFAVPGGQ